MKLGIDLSPFFTESKYRGIGRYARGLLEELIRMNNMDQFHFLNIYGPYEGDPQLNRQCYLHPYYCGPMIERSGGKLLLSDAKFTGYFHAVIDHYMQSSQIDAMLFLSMLENDQPLKAEWFSGVFKIGILYDLIPLVLSDEYLSNEVYRQEYMAALEFIKQMDLLLAISETTKEDAVRLLGIPKEKIVVINAGIDRQFLAAANEAHAVLSDKLNQNESYLLFIGGMDSRKNISKSIQAFAMNRAARERNIKFVIAGLSSEAIIAKFTNIARQYGVADRVIFTGYVSEEKVVDLYRNALALLFPSLYEGFGLPVLEAMCCGTPVITSNTSSLKEVAEGYAYLVDPNQVESISDGITEVLESCLEADERIVTAKKYAMSFHWQRAAQISRESILQLYAHPKTALPALAPFSVESSLMQGFVQRYTEYQMPFRWPNAFALAKELDRLEHAVLSERNHHGTRILYDVTGLCGSRRAGFHSEAGVICEQLRKALMAYAEVVPVTLKTVNDKTVFMQMDTGTQQKSAIVETCVGDIYLVPELQMHEMQVPSGNRDIQAVRDSGVKAYAVLTDMLPLQMPDYFEPKTVSAFAGHLNEILLSYDGILAGSKTVADDFWQYAKAHRAELKKLDGFRIGYFRLGMDRFLQNDGSVSFTIKTLFKGKRPIYLMVGTVDPRKGLDLVLQAFTHLWKNRIDSKLCIIGREGWMAELLVQQMKQHREFGRKLLFLDNADDAVLEYAYQHASALIEASAGEGLDLPIIEAKCYHLPILCSEIPVFHEIAGEHAIYFSREVASLVQCILDFQHSGKVGSAPNPDGIEFETWDDAANCVFSMITSEVGWTHRA